MALHDLFFLDLLHWGIGMVGRRFPVCHVFWGYYLSLGSTVVAVLAGSLLLPKEWEL